jgi:hypothetical protein
MFLQPTGQTCGAASPALLKWPCLLYLSSREWLENPARIYCLDALAGQRHDDEAAQARDPEAAAAAPRWFYDESCRLARTRTPRPSPGQTL